MTKPSDPNSRFMQRLRERQEVEAATKPQQVTPAPDPDVDVLIPEIDSKTSMEDAQLAVIMEQIDIVTAYRKYCGKSQVKPGNRREGIKVSCPNPAHPDKNPSAWLNLDRGDGGLWNCGACEQGGDKYDLAAWHYGLPVPGYKEGKSFPDLRRKMAGDFGWVRKESGGVTFYENRTPPKMEKTAPKEASSVEKSTPKSPENLSETPKTTPDSVEITEEDAENLAEVIDLWEESEQIVFPELDWREISDPGTFLDTWMDTTSADDIPEEYHFWHGLMALGFAVGRDITLSDRVPVLGNLFVCLTGHSGDGKSQSRGYLDRLLEEALPFDRNDPFTKGVKRISTPASAEYMIRQFNQPMLDAENKPIGLLPVRGFVKFNEFAAFTARAARHGSTLKPTLMEFYDGDAYISSGSVTHGTAEAKLPFCSIQTTTQPKAFRELVNRGDVDSGFLNRWIFAGGKIKKRVSIGGVIVDLAPSIASIKTVHAWSGRPRQIGWTSAALTEFDSFFHDVIDPNRRHDETGLLTRTDLTMKKLALLLAVNRKEEEVSVEVVKKLLPIYQYLITCYGISSAAIANTLTHEIRTEILRHIERIQSRTGTGLTIRELNLRIKRKNYPQKTVLEVLDYMTKMGEIEKITVAGKVGRPSVRYQVAD